MPRCLEILISALLLVMMLPFSLMIMVLIKTSMGGPVIFKQKRPGRWGKPFIMYKFRTMKDSLDKDGCLLPDAERMTPLGNLLRKSSLDELPELFNVFKGDMSLVGPRPLLMEYLPLYSKKQARRHEVPPGITGWAQINGRNTITWDRKFCHDVWYVDHHSFWLDLKILCLTVKKVVQRDGINQQGQATAEKFKGNH